MRLSTAFLVALLILGSLISCSKKDPVPEQTCLYAGKTSTIISSTSKIDYGNEIVLNDAKQLASARKIDNSEFFDGSNNRRWKRTITTNYTPQYDTQGFLTQMTTTTVNLYEGTKGYSYQDKGREYLTFKSETIETSDYQYESGHLKSVLTKILLRTQGDNDTPVVTESQQTKAYTYDSQNNPLSALTSAPTGTIISTFKNGIISSEIRRNADGVVTAEFLYNDKGLRTSIKDGNYQYEFEFDANGNRKSVKFTQGRQLNYLQEFSYDDHVNPETHIPVKFKGIPEEIWTAQTSEGRNNLIAEKFTSYAGGSNYNSEFLYQYNANGLPDSWSPKSVPGGETMTTTFRYKCQ